MTSFTLKPKRLSAKVARGKSVYYFNKLETTRLYHCVDQRKSKQRRTQATSNAIATVLHDTALVTVTTDTQTELLATVPQESTITASMVPREVREAHSASEEEDSESDHSKKTAICNTV